MAYIEINKNSIRCNAQILYDFCQKRGIQFCAVTKCCCSEAEIVNIIHDTGILEIADSNQENFKRLPEQTAANVRKSLIKTRLTDIRLIPALAPSARPQRVFVSDEALLEALAEIPPAMRPDIMLTVEMGDLKDGFYPQQILHVIKKYNRLPIVGISAGYACVSGKMPEIKDAVMLSQLANEIKTNDGRLPLASLGGTVAYPLFSDSRFQCAANAACAWELRCGEGIFQGRDSALGEDLSGFENVAFVFFGEILEIREKECREPEHRGNNALGERNIIGKNGNRINMVLDFGVLAAPAKDLRPLDASVQIIGQTYDFTIIDITESNVKYTVGGHIGFAPSYGAVSHAMVNNYVTKVYTS